MARQLGRELGGCGLQWRGSVWLGHEREEEGDPDKVGPPVGERKGTGPATSETGGEGERLGWLLGRPAYVGHAREKGKALRWASHGELEWATGAGEGRASPEVKGGK